MRRIAQPGPATPARLDAVACSGRPVEIAAAPGQPLLESLRRGLAAGGFTSGVARFSGLVLAPFAYVMPALPVSERHVAYYSETFRPLGPCLVESASLTFGERDGAPFFHCHGLWREPDGALRGGHMLPEETVIATPGRIAALGLDGAGFRVADDGETNFRLFGPVPAGTEAFSSEVGTGSREENASKQKDRVVQRFPEALNHSSRDGRFFAVRVRPNIDLCTALERFCAERGIGRAVIHGGVGSTIGARFDDGRSVENFATEVAIVAGTVAAGVAALDVALVDFTGATAAGRLLRGDNPVLMTFELVVEAL